jgi:hypothetical protein
MQELNGGCKEKEKFTLSYVDIYSNMVSAYAAHAASNGMFAVDIIERNQKLCSNCK